VITNHQRYRRTVGRTDRQTDRRHAIPRPRICTKVHCAVISKKSVTVSIRKFRIIVLVLNLIECWSNYLIWKFEYSHSTISLYARCCPRCPSNSCRLVTTNYEERMFSACCCCCCCVVRMRMKHQEVRRVLLVGGVTSWNSSLALASRYCLVSASCQQSVTCAMYAAWILY